MPWTLGQKLISLNMGCTRKYQRATISFLLVKSNFFALEERLQGRQRFLCSMKPLLMLTLRLITSFSKLSESASETAQSL